MPTRIWRGAQRSCFLPLLIARTRSLRSELPIISRPLLNSMRPSLPCAQFWAERVNTWVSVARSPARGCGWFVHASIHVTEVIGTQFEDAREQCRVDPIAVLTER